MNNFVLHKFKHHYRLLMISNHMMTNFQSIIFGVRFISSWYLIDINLIVIVAKSFFTRHCLRNMNIEETSDDINHVKQICSFLQICLIWFQLIGRTFSVQHQQPPLTNRCSIIPVSSSMKNVRLKYSTTIQMVLSIHQFWNVQTDTSTCIRWIN